MSLRQKAISGVKWNSVQMAASQVLSFCTTMVLARILSPSDFGLLGMIMIVINFGFNFSSLGMSNAIVQRKDVPEEHLSTFFWLNNIIGLIIFLIIQVIRYPVAWYFQEPLIAHYLVYSACIFLLIPSTQLFHTLLIKEMKFKPLAIIDISITVIYSVSAISLALLNCGVLSIVFGQIICNVFYVAFCFIYFRKTWLPKFYFQFSEVKSYLRFGAFQMGDRIIGYLSANVDNLIIGRFLGAEALGFYALAYNLITIPLTKINPIILNVAFPMFSKIQDDQEKVRYGYCQMTRFIAFITFPILTGLAVVSPLFIPIAYGDQWSTAIPILQILCMVGLLRTVCAPYNSLLLSKGRADIGFYISIFYLVSCTITLMIFRAWGIIGIALGVLCVQASLDIIIFYNVARIGKINFLQIVSVLTKLFICTVVMALMTYLTRIFLHELNIYTLLAIVVGVGVITYSASCYLVEKKIFKEVLSLIKNR
ncbi:MAG: MOP flippase family protein [Candidatus Auribacterota bacterium]